MEKKDADSGGGEARSLWRFCFGQSFLTNSKGNEALLGLGLEVRSGRWQWVSSAVTIAKSACKALSNDLRWLISSEQRPIGVFSTRFRIRNVTFGSCIHAAPARQMDWLTEDYENCDDKVKSLLSLHCDSSAFDNTTILDHPQAPC